MTARRIGAIGILISVILVEAALAYQRTDANPDQIYEFHKHLPHYNRGTDNLREKMLASDSRVWKVTSFPPYRIMSESDARRTPEQILGEQVCKADAIVTGSVLAEKVLLSADESVLFTDYAIVPDRILKNSINAPLTPGIAFYLTQPGGKLHIAGGTIELRGGAYPPPLYPGKTYLLFMSGLADSKSFKTLSGDSTYFDDNGGHPRAVTESTWRDALNNSLLPLSWNGLLEKLAGTVIGCSNTPQITGQNH